MVPLSMFPLNVFEDDLGQTQIALSGQRRALITRSFNLFA
jgi:hypothetical protein